MSNRRRPMTDHVAGPGECYATQLGVLTDRVEHADELPALRKALHDAVINAAGPFRRSGVWWTHHGPVQAREYLLEQYPADECTEEQRDAVLQYLDALDDPRSMLVIAWCVARTPPGVVPS